MKNPVGAFPLLLSLAGSAWGSAAPLCQAGIRNSGGHTSVAVTPSPAPVQTHKKLFSSELFHFQFQLAAPNLSSIQDFSPNAFSRFWFWFRNCTKGPEENEMYFLCSPAWSVMLSPVQKVTFWLFCCIFPLSAWNYLGMFWSVLPQEFSGLCAFPGPLHGHLHFVLNFCVCA